MSSKKITRLDVQLAYGEARSAKETREWLERCTSEVEGPHPDFYRAETAANESAMYAMELEQAYFAQAAA